MIIYIIIAIILVFNALTKKHISYVPLLVLILISGLRSELVGIDNINYQLAFSEEIPYLSYKILLLKYEPGWLFLNKIIFNLGFSYQYLTILSAIVTILPVYYVCKKVSLYPSLSILLYVLLFYYFLSFSLIRQFIAISFIMLGTFYYSNKNLRLSVFFLVLASMFHYSAIIIFPFIYFSKIFKPKKNIILLMLVASFVIGFYEFLNIFKIIFEIIPFEKYSNYANYKSDISINKINMYLFLIPQNIICYYVVKYTKESIYTRLFFIGVILLNLFLTFPLFSRLAYFFTIYEVLVIPSLIFGNKKLSINSKRILAGIIFVYTIAYFSYYLISNRGGVIPYYFG